MNCKPGDLAIIIYSNITQNIGGLVQVVNLADDGRWRVKPCQPLMGGISKTIHSNIGRIADCNLKPIRGNQKEDSEVKEKELILI